MLTEMRWLLFDGRLQFVLAGAVAAAGTLALYSMRPAAARQAQGRDNREQLLFSCLDTGECWDSGADTCITGGTGSLAGDANKTAQKTDVSQKAL